jgi:hypothetical protein
MPEKKTENKNPAGKGPTAESSLQRQQRLFSCGAVENYAHFFEGDEPSFDHLIEAGEDGVDTLLGLDDFEDDGKIFGKAEEFVGVIHTGAAVAADTAKNRNTGEIFLAEQRDDGLVKRFAVPLVRFSDVNAHQGTFTFEFLAGHGGLLEAVSQTNSCGGKQQAEYDTGQDVSGSAEPFTGFEHFGGFPTETGESGVAAEEADGDGHAPFGWNQYAIESELADKAEKEAAGEVDEQGSIGEGAGHFDLDYALKAVAGQSADGAEQGNEQETQRFSDPAAGLQKKLLEPRRQPGVISVQQEQLKRLKANSIAVRDFKDSLTFGKGRKQVRRLDECCKQQIRCCVWVGHVFSEPGQLGMLTESELDGAKGGECGIP